MHVLGTGVPRRLGVARFVSSPKAAQALGCSLTPGLRILFRRVTCMARAASVPGLWTLGFLLLRGACVWVWVVLRLGFRLRPATLGWGVGVCVRLCAHSACTPPLLAGVCAVDVYARVPVLAAPRHSCLECRGLCLLVCVLHLYPATPGCGVRRGCVWLGSGFGCAPPLLARVLGCACLCARSACTLPLLARVCGLGVCAWARVSAAPRHFWPGCWGLHVCVRALLVPRHSWLGCAVWVCVLGLGFRRSRPLLAGVLACACMCARSACTPLLLAGLCGVGVCGWARVSAAPRHSWLGCWGARVCVPALLVPCPSWMGCAVWVCVFGLGFRLRPATPRLGVGGCMFVCALRLYPVTAGWGVRCGCVCLGSGFGRSLPLLAGVLACVCMCARSACTPPLLAGVCCVGVCVWARVSAAPRHSWLGCWGVCVFVCALRLYPATPGWDVRCGCGCLVSGFGSAPPLLAGVLGCARSCAGSACTPLLLAEVCAVGVCAWARVSAAPRHSWLGCWAVCVFLCALRLYPAPPGRGVGVCAFVCPLLLHPVTPGWGVQCGCVCLGSGFGWPLPLLAGVLGCACSSARSACTQPLLAGVCGVGVCAWARVSAAPRHSWLGCWGVLVCLCARSACTPPLLAGVCGVGLCAWARVSAAPRLSWLGCWGVCLFVCALRLYPATLGWGVWRACVCLGSGFGCTPALLAGVLGCACSCALSACTPPLLAGVCGVGVCAWARVSAPPRHSWLGCWGACLFVCPLRLYPATPGWGVRRACVCLGSGFGCAPPLLAGVMGCVCLCARSACTLPLLAGVCGVGVCAWARVSAAPRHSWLGCWGVCVCVRAPLFLRHSWLGFVVCGLGVAWHLFLCLGSLRVVRAVRVCGTRWPLVLGTCPCAVVVAGGVPHWRPLWPRVGAPRLVRSGRCRCSGRLSRRRGAFLHPGGCRAQFYWAAARGTWRPAENQALCACRWPPPRQRRCACSASYLFGAPRWGCPWRVPPASVLGCVRCSGLLVWTRSPTRPVSRTARLSTEDSPGEPGLFRVDADTAPFGAEDATPGSRACVHVRAFVGRVRRAGLPGAFWCASPFPVAALSFFFVRPPPGLGYPVRGGCCFSFFFLVRPRCLWRSVFSGPGALGLGVLFPPPLLFFSCRPPLGFFFPCFSLVFCLRRFCLFFFSAALFFFFSAVVRCGVNMVCVSGAVGCAGVCCCWRCGLWFVVWFAWCCAACLCLAGFLRLAVRRGVVAGHVVLFLLCSAVAGWCVLCWLFFFALFLAFPWCSVLSWSVWCSAVVRLAVRPCPVALCSCAGFCCAVLFGALPCRGAPLGSVLCCWFRCGAWVVSCLVRCCGVLLCSVCPWARCCVVLLCCLWSVCCPSLCRVFWRLPFRGVSCVVLCWCACVVALCAVLSRPSSLVSCVLARCVWVFAVWPGCPPLSPGGCWCRVSVVLSLSGRVARRPVAWCGVSWCSAPLCCVLWCCAVVWWCAVVLSSLFAPLPVRVICFLPLRFLLCVS